MVERLQAAGGQEFERGTPISQLHRWEAVEKANVLWIQADSEASSQKLVGDTEPAPVRRASDLSGHSNDAYASVPRTPHLRPDAINGHAAFEFDGSCVLKTRPFRVPIPQPVTIMIVARTRGDTTMIDSLGPG